MKITKIPLLDTRKEIASLIQRCRKAHIAIVKGTSQDTLLINRLFALEVVNNLLAQENGCMYTVEELNRALLPIQSIIHKCSKAIQNKEEGQPTYTRLNKTLQAMYVASDLLLEQIQRKGDMHDTID